MRYIKHFESFESSVLSKFLKFITDSSSRSKFIDKISSICNIIGFPESKINDNYLKYLPFKKALNMKAEPEIVKCDNCDSGKDKITGKDCKQCAGTGSYKEIPNEVKIVKIWFDKDGKYITTTGCDGKYRPQHGWRNSLKKFSHNKDDYTMGAPLSYNDISMLMTGQKIWICLENKWVVAMIWRSASAFSTNLFLLQNKIDGGEDYNDDDWKEYAKLSCTFNKSYTGVPRLLLDKDSMEFDPYSWNAPITLSSERLRCQSNNDMSVILKEAHFSLILNVDEMLKSKFKTKSEISDKRHQSRSGLMDNEDIKKANIKRYFSTLSNRFVISDDLENMSLTFFRVFGMSNSFFFICKDINIDETRSIIDIAPIPLKTVRRD